MAISPDRVDTISEMMADGTAIYPGLAFRSDPHVGFYRPAAGKIGMIAVNSPGQDPATAGIFVSDGNVGIGTASPTSKFQINSTTATGLDLNVTAAGADTNYYLIDGDVTQSTVATGAYLSRGNIQGIRSTIATIGNIDHVYAMRGDATLTMAADTEINQHYAGLFIADVNGAKTLTLHDGHVGLQAAVQVDAGVTDVTGGLIAAIFANTGDVMKNVTSTVYGIYVKSTNYTDYGVNVEVESNNITAGMQIRTASSAVLPVGLNLISTSGSITNGIQIASAASMTNLFKFNAAAGPLSVLVADVAGDNTSHKLAIDIGGSTFYLAVWDNGAWS